jgi:AcrR family transcriptional regulator
VSSTPGLRQRKKERTRQAIADAALRLFAERGFDAVTVAEVAAVADVSEKTVFNYFPAKEDLVYDREAPFERELADAVRSRPRGEPAAAAVARFFVELWKRASDPEAQRILKERAQIVAGSRTLQLREREIFEHIVESLAAVIVEEAKPRDELRARVAANALVGTHRALLERARGQALAEEVDARALQRDARRAFALLDRGLGGYAVK